MKGERLAWRWVTSKSDQLSRTAGCAVCFSLSKRLAVPLFLSSSELGVWELQFPRDLNSVWGINGPPTGCAVNDLEMGF